jgi:hypothetical protein
MIGITLFLALIIGAAVLGFAAGIAYKLICLFFKTA